MKIFYDVTLNKSVVYLFSFTKECLPYFTNDLSKQFLVFRGQTVAKMWEINGISEQDALSKFIVAIYVYESDFLVRRKHEECHELIYILSFLSNGC